MQIEITCHNCGEDLNVSSSVDIQGDIGMSIEPCDDCMKSEYESGLEEGRSECE
jgi:hypothetical protein